ncbi:double-headed protease inhibitor, submandibular gland-like [Pelobates fuscus]|uniref:double-headed protease inhibitor, submandibular gland-like n=1 Tax=Pelobates fuscus TaxID=191477 RepID=UPI002FE4BEF4
MSAICVTGLVLLCIISFSGFSSVTGYEVDCSNFKNEVPGVGLACPRLYKPLCGTDGKTYSNKCMMCSDKLRLKKVIAVKHKGSCDIQGSKLDCERFRDSNICTLEFSPHCGSDGISYSNKCVYCHGQNKNPGLSLLFTGHCYDDQD